MPDVLKLLTEGDAKLLQWVIDEVRKLAPPNPSGDYPEENYPSPEVYIVKTPTGGITGLSTSRTGTGTADDPGEGDTAGSADCEVYRIDTNGALDRIDGFTVSVHNLSQIPIREGIFITAKRDKYGSWIADPVPLEVRRGKVASDLVSGSSADMYVYEGSFGSEFATGDIIPNVRNETSCTIKSNVMLTAIRMPENDQWQFLVYRTV